MSNRDATTANLIKRNDWGPLADAATAAPTPSMKVTVVVADAVDQGRLDLTLASLSHQDYPADLLEVVVLDSGTDATLDLPKIRPDRTRIVSVRGGAFDAGVTAADGTIIIRIGAGMVCARDTVSALARWQHVSPDAVSFAPARPITTGWASADEVAARTAADELDGLFRTPEGAREDRAHPLLDRTHQLRTADHLAFLAIAGTPFAFHVDRYDLGTDPHRGADVEIGYRLAQSGAVFVPESTARVWTLPVETTEAASARERRAALTDLMPYPRSNRKAAGRTWGVPLVAAVVPAESYEPTRDCVDHLLAGQETDLHVSLVFDPAGEAEPDRRLLAAEYRSDGRVRLVDEVPLTGYPAPYLLRVPARLRVAPETVGKLIATAERWQAGLVRVLPAGAGSADQAVELWSTAALSRALRAVGPDGDLAATVALTHGQRWETGSDYGVTELSSVPADQLAAAAGQPPAGRSRAKVETVPVGGARSLGKATAFVARRYARAARRRIIR